MTAGVKEQVIRWRSPHTSPKYDGKAEVVMSTVEMNNGTRYIDIRIRKTAEHPKGEGFTGKGMRILPDQALSLQKALNHVLSEWSED